MRHSWSARQPFYDSNGDNTKTERCCLNRCNIIKVTFHYWSESKHITEFWRDGERVSADKTPECVPAEALAEAG